MRSLRCEDEVLGDELGRSNDGVVRKRAVHAFALEPPRLRRRRNGCLGCEEDVCVPAREPPLVRSQVEFKALIEDLERVGGDKGRKDLRPGYEYKCSKLASAAIW